MMETSIEWPSVGELLPTRQCGPFDHAALLCYADVSGDRNPLHLDPDIAQRAGLAAPPIHGMLMMGHLEPLLFAWRPDFFLVTLSVKFLRPVLAGQTLDLSGRVARVGKGETPAVIARLMAHVGADLALLGEATLTPRLAKPCA